MVKDGESTETLPFLPRSSKICMCVPYLKILPHLSFFLKIFGWSEVDEKQVRSTKKMVLSSKREITTSNQVRNRNFYRHF